MLNKEPEYLVYHCSDSRFGNAALVTKWHIERGFTQIGYNKVVLNGWLSSTYYDEFWDGKVETGRVGMGAHVRGYNSKSLGTCLIGMSGKFTDKQIDFVKSDILWHKNKYPNIKIVNHSDLDPKKPHCSGLDLVAIQKELGLW